MICLCRVDNIFYFLLLLFNNNLYTHVTYAKLDLTAGASLTYVRDRIFFRHEHSTYSNVLSG